MRFSPIGHASMGVGDSVVSVDNAAIAGLGVSGESSWITATDVGFRYRDQGGVYRLGTWTVGGAAPAMLDAASATLFRAGGGVWAAFLAGAGVRTSAGARHGIAGLADVSPAGDLVLCPDYQVGRDLVVYGRDGATVAYVTTGPLGQDATGGPNVRLRDGVLAYQADGWRLYRIGAGPLGLAARAVPINYVVPVTAGGTLYLLERETARLTLRPANGTRGWVLATGEALWAPDAIAVAPGILVGWCTNAGETPGSLVTRVQPLDAAQVELDAAPPSGDPAIPPGAPIVTIPGYQVPAQASYGRRGYSGPYFATDIRNKGYGNTPGDFATPGNTEMLVNGTVASGNQKVNRPYFVGLASTGNPPDRILGFLAGGNDDSMGNAGLKGCWDWHKKHFSPSEMIRYYDATPMPQDFINACEREAIVQVQCYPRAGESPSTSIARFIESVDRVIASGRRCGIARGFNTKYGGLQTVLSVQDPLCAMVRARPAVVLDAWFSHGRWYRGVESGAAYCAELLAWEPVLGGLFTGLP